MIPTIRSEAGRRYLVMRLDRLAVDDALSDMLVLIQPGGRHSGRHRATCALAQPATAELEAQRDSRSLDYGNRRSPSASQESDHLTTKAHGSAAQAGAQQALRALALPERTIRGPFEVSPVDRRRTRARRSRRSEA